MRTAVLTGGFFQGTRHQVDSVLSRHRPIVTLQLLSPRRRRLTPPMTTENFTWSNPTTIWTTTTIANTTAPNNCTESLSLSNPGLGVLLVAFSVVVVVGNCMVIVAVSREIYLRTVTNYLIVSLAVADVIVGGAVMPFGISNVMMNDCWPYGQVWCDLWRSLDVMASTASILNLCVISLDRYWAITNPIAYPGIMSSRRVCVLIALAWTCSAGISFPAFFGLNEDQKHQCAFTTNPYYLVTSALVSFYIPTIIMIFVYFKIYRTALAQTEGIKSGSKVTSDCPRGEDGELMTLRIHKGGYRLHNITPTKVSGGSGALEIQQQPRHSEDSESEESPPDSSRHQLYHHHGNSHYSGNREYGNSLHGNNSHHGGSSQHANISVHGENHLLGSGHQQEHQPGRSKKLIRQKIKHLAISKKLTKLAREQKAAKTLGIVVGVFIMCWLPFFVLSLVTTISRSFSDSIDDNTKATLFTVFTFLGYINSGMNPIIYALSMRDFQRAFSKMIFCCPRYRYNYNMKHVYHHSNSSSTSTFSVNNHDRVCVTPKRR